MNASSILSRSFSLRANLTGLLIAVLTLMSLTTVAPGQCASSSAVVAQFGGGEVNDTKTIGDLAYVAMGDAGLVVLDLADEQHIREIGSLRFQNSVTKVDARPGMVFVAEGNQIRAVDVTTPVRPHLIGSIDLEAAVKEIRLRGDILYATTGQFGLAIIDAADPSAMTVLSSVPIANPVRFGVSQGLCYLVTTTAGYVIDVSNPNDPVILSSAMSGGNDVSVGGQTAFVSHRNYPHGSWIDAIDLSTPSQPTVLGTVPGVGFSIAGTGGVLYSVQQFLDDEGCEGGARYSKVLAADVSNPSSPTVLGQFTSFLPACQIHVSGDRILVSVAGGAAYSELALYDGADQGFGNESHFVSRINDALQFGDDSGRILGLSLGSGSTSDQRPRADRVLMNTSDPARPTRQILGSMSALNYFQTWVVNAVAGDIAVITIHFWDDDHNQCGQEVQGSQLAIVRALTETDPQLELLHYSIGTLGATMVGQTVYTATRASPSESCLQIVDVSEPGASILQSQTLTGGLLAGFAVEGQTLYANIQTGTLDVFDVSDPFNPVIVDSAVLPEIPIGSPHVMSDGRVLALASSAVHVLDSRIPGQISQTGVVDLGIGSGEPPRGILNIDDDHVFVWSLDTIWVVSVARRHHPLVVASFPFDSGGGRNDGTFAGVVEGLPYALADGEITILDINQEVNVATVASAGTVDTTFGVSTAGDHAFVSDYFGGLRIFDVADPANPFEVGAYDTPDRAYETVVIGNLAYVADGATGLMVLDVSDPASPTLVGSMALSDLAIGLAVEGDFAYVATRFDGLQILDITNPATPVLVGSVDTPGSAQSVTLDGNLVYVADGSGGVQIIDVTARSSPNIVGSYNTPSSARQVLIRGLVAYVPDRTTGLIALDISDPTNPQLISTLPGLGDTRGVTAWGHLAFVADFDGFIHMVDIADPGDMQLLQTVASLGTPRAISHDGRMLYLADGDAGLTILDAQPCWYNPCPADLVEDGLLDFFDIQAYLNAFSAGDGLADWNDDGQIDFFDLQRYLIDFSAGCP